MVVALQDCGVDIFTLGQYLQPTPKHLPVVEMVTPEKFEHWRQYGEEVVGFRWAAPHCTALHCTELPAGRTARAVLFVLLNHLLQNCCDVASTLYLPLAALARQPIHECVGADRSHLCAWHSFFGGSGAVSACNWLLVCAGAGGSRAVCSEVVNACATLLQLLAACHGFST